MDNALNSALEVDQLALLEFDNIIMGFPQNQILTIESLSQVNTLRSTEKSSGTLTYSASELPVYTFNRDLSMLDKPVSSNSFCIAIKHPDANKHFAIMCDAVQQYQIKNKASIRALPPLMHAPDSPVIGLVKKANSLILFSTAESMRLYIESLDINTLEEL